MLNLFWKCVLLIPLMILLAGCDGEAQVESNQSAAEGSAEVEESAEQQEPAPAPEEVKLTKATWEEVMEATKSHPGKVVVLDVWSTSCQPCLREFPNLVALSEKYPEQVVCLSCSTDYIGISSKPPKYYEEQVRKFLSAQNAKFDNYLCTEAADEIFLKIDLASIPAVYVFGPEGELVERFDNDEQKYGDEFTYEEHILPKVKSLLETTE
ncbi:MAG: redoxin domain-containing protein [Planctomycetaceae bacterium]|nr:redoxin domain-containing protein [Planctomycetaceae bacterium]